MAVIVPISKTDMAADRRRAFRRRLCLEVKAAMLGQSASSAVIHDLSSAGFLIETTKPIAVGAVLEVQLPQQGEVSARVVWGCGRHFGCEFEHPLSAAVVSAATLKAKPAVHEALLPLGLQLQPSQQPPQAAAEPNVARGTRLLLIVILSLAAWAAVAAAIVYGAL